MGTPSIVLGKFCVDDYLINRITLDSPDWTNVEYFQWEYQAPNTSTWIVDQTTYASGGTTFHDREHTGSTYNSVTGQTLFYNDENWKTGTARVLAHYASGDTSSEEITVNYVTIISGGMNDSGLTYTANVDLYCANLHAARWGLWDSVSSGGIVEWGNGTGSFTGTLPSSGETYRLACYLIQKLPDGTEVGSQWSDYLYLRSGGNQYLTPLKLRVDYVASADTLTFSPLSAATAIMTNATCDLTTGGTDQTIFYFGRQGETSGVFPNQDLQIRPVAYFDEYSTGFTWTVSGLNYNNELRGRVLGYYTISTSIPDTGGLANRIVSADTLDGVTDLADYCSSSIQNLSEIVIFSEPPLEPATPTISASTKAYFNRITINNPNWVNVDSFLIKKDNVTVHTLYSGDSLVYDTNEAGTFKVAAHNSAYDVDSNEIVLTGVTIGITSVQSCISDWLINTVSIDNGIDLTDTGVVDLIKSTGGTPEIVQRVWGTTTSYRDRDHVTGDLVTVSELRDYYNDETLTKGDFYWSIVTDENYTLTSEILSLDFNPNLVANSIYTNYPTLSYSASTSNYCPNIKARWYLDDTIIDWGDTGGTGQNSGVLASEDQVYPLKVVFFQTYGGVETFTDYITVDLNYKRLNINLITGSTTFNVPVGMKIIEYAVVAGGGAGGYAYYGYGGGGGAGGMLTGVSYTPVGDYSAVVIPNGTHYGSDSSLSGTPIGNVYTYGGGVGSSMGINTGGVAGHGGSGGGGSRVYDYDPPDYEHCVNGCAGGTGVTGQGHNGAADYGTGGGGGGGAASNGVYVDGGAGLWIDFTETPMYLANGGSGGGKDVTAGGNNGYPAIYYGGGGGGGAGGDYNPADGGAGKQGIVVVNFRSYLDDTPTVETTSVTATSSTSANAVGNLTDFGASEVTAFGFVYNQTQNPTTGDTVVLTTSEVSEGSFEAALTGLTTGCEIYFVRAFATNSHGTTYGDEIPHATESSAEPIPIRTTVLLTYTSGNACVTVPSGAIQLEYLVVAGGGGGAATGLNVRYNGGGGGGAGGMLTGTIMNPAGGTYSTNVGAGAPVSSAGGLDGEDSALFSDTLLLNAIGGGGGGNPRFSDGNDGGSGGGASANDVGGTHYYGGSGTTGQGYKGGDNVYDGGGGSVVGGGGGGAGGAGVDGWCSAGCSDVSAGGVGLASSISGTLVTYSRGGKSPNGWVSSGYVPPAAANSGNGGDGASIGSGYGERNGGAGGSGIVILKFSYPFNQPTGGTATDITCTGATLQWVTNNSEGIDGIYVKVFSGGTWVTVDDISSGATTYNVTGLTPLDSYSYKVCLYNDVSELCSQSIDFTTLDPAPFNLVAVPSSGYADLTFEINDPAYGIEIRPELRLSGTTTFTEFTAIAKNATGYTFSNLDFSESYEARFVRIGSEYPSEIVGFTMPDFGIPTNLNATDVNETFLTLNWTNNEVYDTLTVYYSSSRNSGSIVITPTLTTYFLDDLFPNTIYTIYLHATLGSFVGNSAAITQKTTAELPIICGIEVEDLVQISNTTDCDDSNGYLTLIEPDYTQVYTITVSRVMPAVVYDYNFDDDPSSATYGRSVNLLPSGYYVLKAVPKPEYQSLYGNDTCYIGLIPIATDNTTLTLTDVKVKPTICNGFGSEAGRIDYYLTDSHGDPNVTQKIWIIGYNQGDEDVVIYSYEYALTRTEILPYTFYPEDTRSNCYYVVVENGASCILLPPKTCQEYITTENVEGIGELYITKWDSNTYVNYWDTSLETFYNSDLDNAINTSLKVKEVKALTEEWVKIPLDGVSVTANQKMNKSNVGFTFVDVLNLNINNYDNSKWQDVEDILAEKHVLCYRANTGYWYVMGYRHGAELNSFEDGTNLILEFSAISRDKILPEVDYTYVNDYVLTGSSTILDNCDFIVPDVKKAFICSYTSGGTAIDFPIEYDVEDNETWSSINTTWDTVNKHVTIGDQVLTYKEVNDFGQGSLSMKEQFQKTNAGKEYVKTFELKIPQVNLYATTSIKETVFGIADEFRLAKTLILIETFDDQLWVMGYDHPMILSSYETKISGENGYVLSFQSRSSSRMRNFIRL